MLTGMSSAKMKPRIHMPQTIPTQMNCAFQPLHNQVERSVSVGFIILSKQDMLTQRSRDGFLEAE